MKLLYSTGGSMEEKFIEFLKKSELYNEEVLDYIEYRTTHVDYKEKGAMDFVGCYPILEDGIVKDIWLCVPNMVDDISISINIHEYVHLLRVYKSLGKKFEESEYEELLPVMYEFAFLEDVGNTEYLEKYKEDIKDDEVLKVLVKDK